MTWTEASSKDVATKISGGNSFFNSDVFTPSPFMQTIDHIMDSAAANTVGGFRLGKTTVDTSTKYSYRSAQNNDADLTDRNDKDRIQAGLDGGDQLAVSYFCNIAGEEKLAITTITSRSGAAVSYPPQAMKCVGKYMGNQSSQFDIYQKTAIGYAGGNRDIDVGSNLTVFKDVTAEGLTDGTVFYEKDTNKSYILYNSIWSEL